MSQGDDLNRIKSDEEALKQAYRDAGGKEQDGFHNSCLDCDSDKSFSFFEKNGRWHFKCHFCGIKGTIVDLVMLHQKVKCNDAIKIVLEKYGHIQPKPGGAHKKKKELKKHPDPDSAFEAALWFLQQREPQAVFVKKWVYQRGNCEPFGQVARFDIPQIDPGTNEPYVKKEFRPAVFVGTGWQLTATHPSGDKWPMLFLPKILKALSSGDQK